MIQVIIFSYKNHGSHFDNHQVVLSQFNAFLKQCEEKDYSYIRHNTYFLESDRVTIEVVYRQHEVRKVLIEKTVL